MGWNFDAANSGVVKLTQAGYFEFGILCCSQAESDVAQVKKFRCSRLGLVNCLSVGTDIKASKFYHASTVHDSQLSVRDSWNWAGANN